MREIWKDVKGYEGLYQVSNYGEVFGCKRNMKLKTSHDKYGYIVATLTKNSKPKTLKVHRLVATAFINNPLCYPCINHKDEIKDNNSALNLEWCTVAYNNSYGTHNNISKKAVQSFDSNGELIKEYESASSASRHVGIVVSSIVRCCNKAKGYHTAKGCSWRYKGGDAVG
ncbi:MAG: hypothetical protein EOM05_12725 [Clostridia bacterium]|nr:hypothetical protein [Clostridia bacterium]